MHFLKKNIITNSNWILYIPYLGAFLFYFKIDKYINKLQENSIAIILIIQALSLLCLPLVLAYIIVGLKQ